TRTYKVSGAVVDSSGRGAVDIVIRVAELPQTLTITGPSGSWSFDLPAGASYTLTPSTTGSTFDPPSFSVDNLNRDYSRINFVEVPHDKVHIGGTVADDSGAPLPDVVVGLGGSNTFLTSTGAGGTFDFVVPKGGNYTVTPARNGYSFTPPTLSFNNVT